MPSSPKVLSSFTSSIGLFETAAIAAMTFEARASLIEVEV